MAHNYCRACGLRITGLRLTVRGEGDYHENCLRCSKCLSLLRHANVYLKKGSFYCKKDYIKIWAPKCRVCALPIEENGVQAHGYGTYHSYCFKCCHCRKVMGSEGFAKSGGLLCCPKCFIEQTLKVHDDPLPNLESSSRLTEEENPLPVTCPDSKEENRDEFKAELSCLDKMEHMSVQEKGDGDDSHVSRQSKIFKRIKKAPRRIAWGLFKLSAQALL